MVSFGGANRDPEACENPDEFNIDRDNTYLLSFGFGAHYCLGVHQAKARFDQRHVRFPPDRSPHSNRPHGIQTDGNVQSTHQSSSRLLFRQLARRLGATGRYRAELTP